MNRYTELISKYINGELSATEKTAFETELNSNTELKKEYELQLNITKGAERMGLKQQLSSSFKTVKTKKLITKGLIGLTITLAVLGAVVAVKKMADRPENHINYELNEQGNTNWSEADKKLESQIFQINPDRDTIIETQQGIVVAIPAASFEQQNGEGITGDFDLEIKEAMTAAQIMNAGLSTMSNEKLLETGGMFYINARQGNNNLVVNTNKPLNVNVPVNNDKNDMMLFKGERMTDGSINWVDPKPMKRTLSTVDITKLNFYPEDFLDTIKALGFNSKNKKITDSIYYSFGGCGLYDKSLVESDFSIGVSDTILVSAAPVNTVKPDGEKLFRRNCAVCHSANTKQKFTGPGLEDVIHRVPGTEWMKKWILNSDKLTASGDAYARKIKQENGNAAMSVFEGSLSETEINAIIKYLTGKGVMNIDDTDGRSECSEIAPARVKAIWDKKFNNTIIATKEFEERLKVIFTTCEPRILNLYVNNMDKNLYEIDSTAATLLDGDLKLKFIDFYKRKDGGVDIGNEQNRKLQAYFEEKRAIYTKAAFDAAQKILDKDWELNQKALEKQNARAIANFVRSSTTFREELEINLDEAYRQIGKKRTSPTPSNNYTSADIVQTGWNNLDRYVLESTNNRTTLDYTDPENGKKAIIKYEPVSIKVENAKDYDRIVCYMIPDKLSSFQLMKKVNDVFTENLNELMDYSIVTIGFKGNSTFYHEQKHTTPKAYTVSLKPIKAKELDQKLNASFPLNKQQDLLRDIDYQQFDLKETKRQEKIRQREEIQYRLSPVVFPCKRSPATPEMEAEMIQRAMYQADSISKILSKLLQQ